MEDSTRKKLQLSNWDNSLLFTDVLLLESEDPLFNGPTVDVESHLHSLGISGATNMETSPSWRQNISGIDGWMINLRDKTYTRIDSININHLSKEGCPKVTIDEVESIFTTRLNSITAKGFGLGFINIIFNLK